MWLVADLLKVYESMKLMEVWRKYLGKLLNEEFDWNRAVEYARLKWFVHIADHADHHIADQIRCHGLLRRCSDMVVEGDSAQRKGRERKMWQECVNKDMK
jgi:hypothetical protein